jgi:hypothetical protein
LLIVSASISAYGVVEKHKGIVIRVVVIIASCPLPDVGQPPYSGSDNDGWRFSRRCLRSAAVSSAPAVYRTTVHGFASIDRFTEMTTLPQRLTFTR